MAFSTMSANLAGWAVARTRPWECFGVFLAVGFPGVDADSGVRVGDVAIAIPDSMHFVESFLVGGAVSPNLLTNIFKAIATEIEQAWKIVGISDVHGI